MAVTLRLGARGPSVERLQARLAELGFYAGRVDGDFGGGTYSAVRRFQATKNLEADGVVGENTWKALLGADSRAEVKTPEPSPHESEALAGNAPLRFRCLALTGSFETDKPPPDCYAGVSGNFDGQGLSFGVCQWNFGQGSLQPMLTDLIAENPDLMQDIFGEDFDDLQSLLTLSRSEQLKLLDGLQTPKKNLVEPWLGYFRVLGRSPACQAMQVRYAAKLFESAEIYRKRYQLHSQRALALMFDIMVQNGGINAATHQRIAGDCLRVSADLSPEARELAVMVAIANRRADAANPRWREDVRDRKLTIAHGIGVVHGRHYDLAQDYALSLTAG